MKETNAISSQFDLGWELLKASWRTLMQEKRLLWFPILSGICCLAMVGVFIFYLELNIAIGPLLIGAGLLYFGLFFIAIFFNVATVACALELLVGGKPTLNFGLQRALIRLPQIVGWSIICATVGIILSAVEDRSSWVRSLVAYVLGIAWLLSSYLVIPVFVAEGIGPIEALHESIDLLSTSWGGQLVGAFGFETVYGWLCAPGALLIVYALSGHISFLHPDLLHGLSIIVGAVYLLLMSIFHSSLQAIFQAALYLHAHDGSEELSGFPASLIKRAVQVV